VIDVQAVYKSNDPVELGWLLSVLRDAGFEAVILDTHTSIVEGSVGAIPRRIVVPDSDKDAARALVEQALHSIVGNVNK
tara:strand:+ start:214 stop:450 length:237 start_codon:yes stop_codon:yes gene_type:complete